MSKERELLERWIIDFGKIHPDIELMKETKELLAQPEQESANFDLDRMKLTVESPISEVTVEGLIDKVKSNRVFYQEGYAQAELDLKREPLTPQEISDGNQSMFNATRDAFVKGIRFAEKHHGIGGEE